jgi:hypothetical protein
MIDAALMDVGMLLFLTAQERDIFPIRSVTFRGRVTCEQCAAPARSYRIIEAVAQCPNQFPN